MIRGGHRFWTAPEADHSYAVDNDPVTWKKIGDDAVEIVEPAKKPFGFQKTLRVELLANEVVRITHLLTNASGAALDVTPWSLSVMAPGGVALIPQPALDLHPSEFPEGRGRQAGGIPAQSRDGPVALHRPDRRPLRLQRKFPARDLPAGDARHQARPEAADRLGRLPELGDVVFAKHFAYDPAQPYPDRGCNFELFTNIEILELESLAPLQPSAPGATSRRTSSIGRCARPQADLRGEKAAVEFFAGLPRID